MIRGLDLLLEKAVAMLFDRRPRIDKLTEKNRVRGLIKALRYPDDATVRAAAVDALGGLGDRRAVEPLLGTLGDDDDARVRRAAVAALGRLEAAQAVGPVAAVLEGDDPSMSESALAALTAIGAPSVDALGAALTAGDGGVRPGAAKALGDIGDLRAVGVLRAGLRDSSESVRKAAADALDRLGWTPEDDVAAATYWVARREWKKCARIAAIAPLIAVLDDEDATVRDRASSVLVRIGAPAVPPLIAALGSTPAAGAVLARIGTPAVEPLIATLGRGGAAGAAAARTLGGIRDVRALEPLLTALHDQDEAMRREAAQGLGQLTDARSVEALGTALHDPSTDVRKAATVALHRIGDPRATQALTGVLHDPSADVREAAAGALDDLGWHPDEGPAGAAYWAVRGEWGRCAAIGAPAVDALIGVLHDRRSSRGVLVGAAEALVAMYHSGRLDDATKRTVLAEHDVITGVPVGTQIVDDDDRDSLRFGSRPAEYETVYVDFPLGPEDATP